MATFRFRPAPVRSERVFQLESGILSCSVDDAVEWTLPLSTVQNIAFVSYKAHGRMIWRLDLITLNSTLNVTGNVPAKGGYIDSGFTEFHGLVTALVEHFTTFKPDLKVVFGEHGRARTIMFIIGLFSALGGGGLFATALLGGVSSNRMTEAAIPFVALFILGGVLIRANHPWKAPTKIDVSLLPQLLTYLSGSSVNSEHWE